MKPALITLAVALAFGALAGCDRSPDPRQRPAGTGSTASPAASSNTPTTPANAETPSQEERKESSQPVQGQVDTKQAPQRKDFQQKGG